MTQVSDIKCIRTRANGSWTIVKVLTDQPGLYGIGSASDYRHSETVIKAVETVAPAVIGREAGQIEDIWQSVYASGYWRNGSILNTALGAIDVALWDIKGKEAGMPVYDLLGGPCRAAVPCYAHAGGSDLAALEDSVRAYVEEGYSVIRCQLGAYGGGGFLAPEQARQPKTAWPQARIFDDEAYLENIPAMFDYLRSRLGFGIKLTHDVHEHLRPHNAVRLAKLLEPYPDSLVPPDPRTVHHTPGHGRALCQPPRVGPADHGTADRLCARACFQGRRHHALPQNRRSLRMVWRTHRLAGRRGQ
jgi:mannonate dehydratase